MLDLLLGNADARVLDRKTFRTTCSPLASQQLPKQCFPSLGKFDCITEQIH